MPFLTSVLHSRGQSKSLTPWEQIKSYHEIKSIQSQKRNNRIIAFLTFFIVVLTGLQIYAQYNSSQLTDSTIKPDIEINLFDTASFNTHDVSSIWHGIEGDFGIRSSTLNFGITNFGQKDTNYINIDLKDPKEEYVFDSSRLENLKGLQNDFFQIESWSKACNEAYWETKTSNGSWETAWDKCSELRKNLTIESREILLRLNCPGCEFNKRFQCYSLKVCIYDSNSTLCGKDPGYHKLKETDCPEDW